MKKIAFILLFALTTLITVPAKAQTPLTPQKALEYYLKLTKENKKKFSTEYLYQSDHDTYKKYWDDEFALHSKLKDQYHLMLKRVKNFDLNSTYYVLLKTNLGRYNFQKKAFKFNPLPKGYYFPVKEAPEQYSCKICKTFTRIRLIFTNGNDINYAPMAKSKARKFIESRKQQFSGNVNRSIVLKIYFKPTKKMNVQSSNLKNMVTLHGTVTKAKIIDTYGMHGRSGSHEVISVINIDKINGNQNQSSKETTAQKE